MLPFVLTLASVTIVSLLSFIGLFTLSLNKDRLHAITHNLVGFSAGVLLGATFFHILPEITGDHHAHETTIDALPFVLLGIVLSFLLERLIHWHHCDKENCDVRPAGYVNLLGDGLHNFSDGIIIAAAYLVDTNLGLITTLAVLIHETPQEIGDFAVLLHSGFSRRKALTYNFISATTAILGAIIGYLALPYIEDYIPLVLAVAGGSFLYISLADLMPEMHKGCELKKDIPQISLVFIGIILMWVFTQFLHI